MSGTLHRYARASVSASLDSRILGHFSSAAECYVLSMGGRVCSFFRRLADKQDRLSYDAYLLGNRLATPHVKFPQPSKRSVYAHGVSACEAASRSRTS